MTPVPRDTGDQEHEFRQILARLTLLSHGRTQTFGGRTTGTSERDPRPQGEANPPQDRYAERWNTLPADDTDGRRKVIDDARRELEATLKAPRMRLVEETWEQRRKYILENSDGWEARIVARVKNVGIRDVHRAREETSRDLETGRAYRVVRLPVSEERVRRAREMDARGMTARQIGLRLGVSADTVRRDLGKRRRAA
jgi:hypothetical protein